MLSAMRTRSVLAVAVPFLLLSACAPAAPADSPEPSDPAPTETEFPGGVAIGLPEDGLLGMHATLTALNGAVLVLTMIVHRSVAATDAAASADAAAMESWCSGEIDAQILADQGYTLTVVDVDATLTSGEWPTATPVLLYPIPWERAVLTASGDLTQVSTGSEGDSTPHCITPVTLDGPGSGTIIVGIAGDADGDGDGTPPLGGWAHNLFGADATLPGGTLSDVMFTNCYTEVSELGASLGAGTVPGWNTWFDDPTFCYVGSFGQG
jgi:hypothetical protein